MANGRQAVSEPERRAAPQLLPIVVGDDGDRGGRDARELGRLLAAVEGAETRVLSHHGAGSPAKALIEAADQAHAGTLVVGAPRHVRAPRALQSSVSRQVLHHAPCEVAVAPHGYAARRHAGIAKVAVAYDGSTEARLALKRAEALARTAGARIEVLVAEDPVVTGVEVDRSLHDPDVASDVLEEALAAVDPAVPGSGRRLDPGWRKVGRTIAAAIAEASADADLLLAGSRRPVDRFLLGSVTNNLVGATPCPLIVVPRPE